MISCLQEWDVSKTDQLLQDLQEKQEQISALEAEIFEKEKKRLAVFSPHFQYKRG